VICRRRPSFWGKKLPLLIRKRKEPRGRKSRLFPKSPLSHSISAIFEGGKGKKTRGARSVAERKLLEENLETISLLPESLLVALGYLVFGKKNSLGGGLDLEGGGECP